MKGRKEFGEVGSVVGYSKLMNEMVKLKKGA
jgi:hypothetical protein